jgi:hypothetical protein
MRRLNQSSATGQFLESKLFHGASKIALQHYRHFAAVPPDAIDGRSRLKKRTLASRSKTRF